MATTHKFSIESREVKATVIKDEGELERGLKDFLLSMTKDKNAKHVVSLDIEKDFSASNSSNNSNNNKVSERVSLLKLCSGTTCLIVQLLHMKSPPLSLSKFLQLQELAFVGVGIGKTLGALERDYGITCRNAVDLGQLAAAVKEREIFEFYGLVELADLVYPHIDVDKVMASCHACALSNWAVLNLSKKQIEAATRSAFWCFFIGNDLFGGYLPSASSDP